MLLQRTTTVRISRAAASRTLRGAGPDRRPRL